MIIINLKKLGKISENCAEYLSKQIANICKQNEIKYHLGVCAKRDFSWKNENLIEYISLDQITEKSYKIENYLSSGEWLCGIFNSGPILFQEHIKLMMLFVNPHLILNNKQSNDFHYICGKDSWKSAPTPLKEILDILDDSICENKYIKIKIPKET